MFQRILQHILLASSVILNSNTSCSCANRSKVFFKSFSRCNNSIFINHNLLQSVKFNQKNNYSRKNTVKLNNFYLAKQGIPQLGSSKMDSSKCGQVEIEFNKSPKGMKTLDKSAFNSKLVLPCVIVEALDLQKILYMIRGFQFKRIKLNSIIDYNEAQFVSEVSSLSTENTPDKISVESISSSGKEPDCDVEGGKIKVNTKKVILLNPQQVSKYEDFGVENTELLKSAKLLPEHFTHVEVPLTYDNFTAEEILQAILPDDVMLSSFTMVGHIAQCNLKEELHEYRHIVGNVLLDKVPSCQTVVNKAHSIDNTYRNFQMELLAGKDDMITVHKENGCVFKMDFSKVYWNSRLSTEHERVTKEVNAGDLVLDVFAGVGPFSIPAAQKGATVFANDLNPDSFAWLNASLQLNKKALQARLTSSNKDARDFLQSDARAALSEWIRLNPKQNGRVRILMNLPAKAVEYVQYVKMLSRDEYRKLSQEPLLYLYCFLPKMNLDTKEKIPKTRAAADLLQENGIEFDAGTMTVNFVRNVAPNKDMYKILMKLGEGMMVNEKRGREEDVEEEEGGKKLKNSE